MEARTVYKMMEEFQGSNYSEDLREELYTYLDNWTESYPAFFSDRKTLIDLVEIWIKRFVPESVETRSSARDFANDYEYDLDIVVDFLFQYRPELRIRKFSEIEISAENDYMFDTYGFLFDDLEDE